MINPGSETPENRIYIFENEPDNFTLLKMKLEGLGYTVAGEVIRTDDQITKMIAEMSVFTGNIVAFIDFNLGVTMAGNGVVEEIRKLKNAKNILTISTTNYPTDHTRADHHLPMINFTYKKPTGLEKILAGHFS